MILLALVLFDAFHGRFRIKVYLFHAAGWLALLVWIPAIRASMAAGKPHGWIPVPTFSKLFDSYFFWDYLPWLSLVQRHAPDFLFQVCRHGIQVAILLPVAVVLSFAGRKLLGAKRSFSPTQEDALLLVAFCASVDAHRIVRGISLADACFCSQIFATQWNRYIDHSRRFCQQAQLARPELPDGALRGCYR